MVTVFLGDWGVLPLSNADRFLGDMSMLADEVVNKTDNVSLGEYIPCVLNVRQATLNRPGTNQ
jgi:hypothetical protein